MDLIFLLDLFGEAWTQALGGLVIGIMFGSFAQQSRFCLRAATVEFWRGTVGERTSIWLIVFFSAMAGTSLLAQTDAIMPQEARQIASPQSLSGAALGGLMFGSGMILSRGCASRLLVLAATGNLRALLSGLVFAVMAQASLHGILSPIREALARVLTTTSTGGNDILQMIGMDGGVALALASLAGLVSIALAATRRVRLWTIVCAAAVGSTVPLAWWFTHAMSGLSFSPVQMNSITFTGPSANTLMLFLNGGVSAVNFATGLVPGVFAGSFLAALLAGELQLQGFEGGQSMKRYLTGAALMGFGGMLAGGCAVGAGVTGASVFALTAWVTLFAIWFAAGATDWLFDRPAK